MTNWKKKILQIITLERSRKMENSLATQSSSELISNLVLNGDISKMSNEMKVEYYNKLCHSLNLNPVTKPFQIISFQGKTILYATKDCTEQLRKINKVSIVELNQDIKEGLCISKCKVQDKDNRYDIATGVVVLPSDAIGKANGIMKCETKAKRRATLSICGLGILEESELDTMPAYVTVPISDIQKIESKDKKAENVNGSQFYIELKNKIRESLGGKMNVKEAIEQLNKLTGGKLDKFPTDEQVCKELLLTINNKENGN